MRVSFLAVLAATALAGCGSDGDDGMSGGASGGDAVSEQTLMDFYGTQAPIVRAGVLDGTQRIFDFTNGGSPSGVTVTPTGGNTYSVAVDVDLGGTARAMTIPMSVVMQGDPTDGLQAPDFPITVQIQDAETPFGTYSASMTVEGQGGGQTVTIMGVSGTATLVNGARMESHEFGYQVDVTFPNLPLGGWEYIEITGAGTAEYDVCYRFNGLAGQYVRVWGTANGSSFDMEFGGQPQEGSFPCEE